MPSRPRNVLNFGFTSVSPPGTDLARELRRAALMLNAAHASPLTGRPDSAAACASQEFIAYGELARALTQFDPGTLVETAEKRAFWINLYNSLTIHAVLAFRPRGTVWAVPGFFRKAAYDVGGLRFSLDDIEHGILRANRPAPGTWWRSFGQHDPRRVIALAESEFDARIHFALNCGARSCPPIACYEPARIDAQLDLATRAFLTSETEIDGTRVLTTPILKWYRRDFEPTPLAFLARHLPAALAAQVLGKRLAFRRYDWRLNSVSKPSA